MSETTNNNNELGNQAGKPQVETPVTPVSETLVYTSSNQATESVKTVAPTQSPIQQTVPVQNSNYAKVNQMNHTIPVQSAEENYDTTPMTMKDWVLTILAGWIPCCGNIILYCIWAFGKSGNLNRRNYCRVMLIIWGIAVVFYCFIGLLYGSLLISVFDLMGAYY